MKKLVAILLCLLLAGCSTVIIDEEVPSIYDTAMDDGQVLIVVDAGHGLSDVGAINEENLGTITEADINFAVASALSGFLAERGYTVVMSHDGETKPETKYDDGEDTYGPGERADFSNAQAADLFISIHCDSFPTNTDVYGTRLYYGVDTPNSSLLDQSFAEALKYKIEEKFPSDKKVILKPMSGNSAYTVLYKTTVPSVLVECGFITNASDAKKLTDESWQKDFASSLADGIDMYFEK
ncbi:MAG: N-acetylmuramoyl-L-alanine amidase [Ruminococcaceae bacterium]|nr:N-acetylmuramoyl-L-alanine amidase [Oscillospiraceae bacterium]